MLRINRSVGLCLFMLNEVGHGSEAQFITVMWLEQLDALTIAYLI